ncbi:hypothetical protein ACHAPM_011458 [Fusarium culmorum]
MYLLEKFHAQNTGKQRFVVNVSSTIMHSYMQPATTKHAAYAFQKSCGTMLFQMVAKDTPVDEMQIASMHPGLLWQEEWVKMGFKDDVGFDNIAISGNFAVWLATPNAAFLHGLFAWASWDVNELSEGPLRKRIDEDPYYLKMTDSNPDKGCDGDDDERDDSDYEADDNDEDDCQTDEKHVDEYDRVETEVHSNWNDAHYDANDGRDESSINLTFCLSSGPWLHLSEAICQLSMMFWTYQEPTGNMSASTIIHFTAYAMSVSGYNTLDLAWPYRTVDSSQPDRIPSIRSKYLLRGCYTPFGELIELKALAKSIVKPEGTPGNLTWAPGGRPFTIGDDKKVFLSVLRDSS